MVKKEKTIENWVYCKLNEDLSIGAATLCRPITLIWSENNEFPKNHKTNKIWNDKIYF